MSAKTRHDSRIGDRSLRASTDYGKKFPFLESESLPVHDAVMGRPLMSSVVQLIAAVLLSGCAKEHLKTEQALTAAQFVQYRGTPEVATRLKEYPPYTFLQIQQKKQKPKYVFSSPARKTIFVGDEAALKRYSAYLTAQQQSDNMRRVETQQRAANFQQALASGLAAGAVTASQQPVYQAPIYQPPPQMQIPSFQAPQMQVQVPQTTTFRPDGFGGYRGSDGSTVKPDGFGGYRVNGGY